MEFRLLTEKVERAAFASSIDVARAAHAAGFRENSCLKEANQQRLENSMLYGLFSDGKNAPEQMIAGIAMHSLEAFPQSCNEPDLSYLSAADVLECSDHWSLDGGAGMLAWAGLAMPMRLLGTKAVLAYLAAEAGDSDHAGFYASMGFVKTGSLVRHPFVENSSGEKLLVQPVVLEGEALQRVINGLARNCLEFSDDGRIFRLRSFVRPHVRRSTSRRAEMLVPATGGTDAAASTAVAA